MSMAPVPDSVKGIMTNLETNTAFADLITADIDAAITKLAPKKNIGLLGRYSPLYRGVADVADDATYTLSELNALTGLKDRDGNPLTLTSDVKTALVGKKKGIASMLSVQAKTQFTGLEENLMLYASAQSADNALGNTQGCGSLNDHFGSVAEIGHAARDSFVQNGNLIDANWNDMITLKNNNQGAINTMDYAIMALLNGKINSTVYNQADYGSGIYDQVDTMLAEGGYTGTTADRATLKTQIDGLLPAGGVASFFDKKIASGVAAQAMASHRGAVMNTVGKEATSRAKSLTTLKRLGSARAISNMFENNECMQTLLGFVGTPALLANLGGSGG